MKRFSFICSVLIAVTFYGCSEDVVEQPTTGSIVGSVSDRTTGEPVATVNVSISPGGSSTVTGSDGTFSFRNLYENEYTLSINKEGYKPNKTDIYVPIGVPTSVHLLMERIPAIVTADRDTLDFGSNISTNTLSFNIVNSSYEDLKWTIEERCDWIVEITPSEGVLAYGKTEGIIVVIDREKLASGKNETIIVIRSSNGTHELLVTARNLAGANYMEIEDINIAVQKEDIGYGLWSTVNSLCENSILDGYTDWRLPTIDELVSLYLMRNLIGGFMPEYYWSNKTKYDYTGDIIIYGRVNFSNGYKQESNILDGGARGRCVRTLKK